MKMSISCNNDRVKELITHNKLCDPVAEQHNKEASGEDKMFMFHHIQDHKGPLKPGNSECNGSRCDIKIEREDAGVTTWEPLTIMGKCNPATCAVCGKKVDNINCGRIG